MLPLSKPALATLALLSFLTNWNDFLWPVYVLFSPENRTLQAGLATLQSANSVRYDLLMAAAVVASVPVLLLFVLAQRYVIEGVSRSGVKGWATRPARSPVVPCCADWVWSPWLPVPRCPPRVTRRLLRRRTTSWTCPSRRCTASGPSSSSGPGSSRCERVPRARCGPFGGPPSHRRHRSPPSS
ncbi:MAG: hypothetical protein M3419_05520 [Actinomycetota bacterium]|nr:hypothetical protein [Actinomycetota bacterium]